MKKIFSIIASAVLLAVIVFCGLYFTRFCTMHSIHKLTNNADYNLYEMEVKYQYDLDKIIARGITNDQSCVDAMVASAIPILPVHIKVPHFGCSAFTMQDNAGTVRMGRNYDFKQNCSALMVKCTPKHGYKSIAFVDLNNIKANNATSGIKTKMACLTAPFICLDGINEKGVSIAVLTLDSDPTRQHTGKPAISTTLAIRLVLDRAASTREAISLLQQYDMFAIAGRDHHFYITDASGYGCVVEYDCHHPERPLVATPTAAITNFFKIYENKVLPHQKNGIYGHGKERYDTIMNIMDTASNHGYNMAWLALQAASQAPNPIDITSNTQWSIVYDNTNIKADIAIRRQWDHIHSFTLK